MSIARIAGLLALALAAGAALVWAFWPEPLPVDTAGARVAPMQVTVAAEGVTRVRSPYVVTAPRSGHALSSPVEVGETVLRDQTVVALIQPAEPAFLDARARAQAEAAVAEAEAGVRMARSNLEAARAELTFAANQLARNRELAARGTIPQRMLEDSEQVVETRRAAVEAAESELSLRDATLARAQAQLMAPDGAGSSDERTDCCVELRAPRSGTVLSVAQTSPRLVQAGEPMLTIGDLDDLQIEVDLLSSDAVRLDTGARATIERWGGEHTLAAQVRRIDPSGFARVSALGIEEQRVRVILDFLDPPAARAGLGDAFRVFVRIVIWEEPQTLQVPVSALFRDGENWAVFVIENGTARLRHVETGQRTQTEAQIHSGLAAGDTVVAYPGDRVVDGARVVPRESP